VISQNIPPVNRNNSLLSGSNIFSNPNHQSHGKFIINNNNTANQVPVVTKPQLLRKYSEDQTVFVNNNNLTLNNNRNLIQQHLRTSNINNNFIPVQSQEIRRV
jgi:hypothetical protein